MSRMFTRIGSAMTLLAAWLKRWICRPFAALLGHSRLDTIRIYAQPDESALGTSRRRARVTLTLDGQHQRVWPFQPIGHGVECFTG